MKTYGLIISDPHAGSDFSLVPPIHRKAPINPDDTTLSTRKVLAINHLRSLQVDAWNQFRTIIEGLPMLDFLICGGDLIEGPQPKSDGAELITPDTEEQADICRDIFYHVWDKRPKKVFGVNGTHYHVGGQGGGDLENDIYESFPNIEAYGGSLSINHRGIIYDVSHFVGRSGTPYGKQTAPTKAIIQNVLNSAREEVEEANVILRGHVHYCVSAGFPMQNKIAMTLPCLKFRGERYGRRFSGLYSVGMILVEHTEDGKMPNFYPLPIKVRQMKREVYDA